MKDTFSYIGISRLRMLTDGDGVTTLVAGHGCPLRCKYCLNPQCFVNNATDRTIGITELINELSIDDLYFQATGGGICFGGGEPLLQADFIHQFKMHCPSHWKIYLESSLNVPLDNLILTIDDIDYFIIDIKDIDPNIYFSYTGKTNDRVINNLKYLISKKSSSQIIIRVPLIPRYNNSDNQKKSISYLKSIGFEQFDIFTYDISVGANKLTNI